MDQTERGRDTSVAVEPNPATATGTFITAHGGRSVSAGLARGYSVAFTIVAVFLGVAAVISAVLVTGRPDSVPAGDVDPVWAPG